MSSQPATCSGAPASSQAPHSTDGGLTPEEIGDRVFGAYTGGQDYGVVRWFNAGLTQWSWATFFREPKPEWYTDPGSEELHLVHGIAVGAAVT